MPLNIYLQMFNNKTDQISYLSFPLQTTLLISYFSIIPTKQWRYNKLNKLMDYISSCFKFLNDP